MDNEKLDFRKSLIQLLRFKKVCVCLCVCECPQKSKKGFGFSGAGIRDG